MHTVPTRPDADHGPYALPAGMLLLTGEIDVVALPHTGLWRTLDVHPAFGGPVALVASDYELVRFAHMILTAVEQAEAVAR
jgi:hypothetical protein